MDRKKVSIPIGFSSSLQLGGFDQERIDHHQVSIPIGFSSSLQPTISPVSTNVFDVSIPIGFSSSLQQRTKIACSRCYPVSIPIGFSSSLQPPRLCLYTDVSMFQSLSGFQVRCNFVGGACPAVDFLVSIPIGFSSSLQPKCGKNNESVIGCFNPYRVFKFVAT